MIFEIESTSWPEVFDIVLAAGDQFEDWGARRGGAERVGGRAGGYVEETLDLRLEAIEKRLDHFGLIAIGKLADGERFSAGAAAQHDVAGGARIAGPCRFASRRDQPSAAVEVEHVDGSGEEFARFSAADFEQAHVSGRESKPKRLPHHAVEESIDGAFLLKGLGHVGEHT